MPSIQPAAVPAGKNPVLTGKNPPSALPVRLGRPGDRAAILALLRLQHDEAPLAEPDWKKIGETVDACLAGNGGLAVVCLEGERIVATAGAVASQLWWTSDWHLGERWFFVHPDHRKSRHAARMAEFLKARQKQLGIPLINSVFSSKDTERKVRFFSRHFRMIGAIFMTGD